MKRGIGIIGYGGFGRFLHKQWNRMNNARVVAVADEDPARDPHDNVRFTTNWRDLIQWDEVEVVSICTPPSTHGTLAVAAMEAGKHVLVEKPIATTLEDADFIIETRNRTEKVAAVNYMLRFNPIVEILAGWARDLTFGPLRRAVVENYAQDEALPKNHWFWDEEVSGGILVEHSVHFLDIVDQLAAAPVRRVQGAAHDRNKRQRDQVMALVEYEDGLIASHYHEFARPNIFERTTMRLVFDAAEIDLEGWIPLAGAITAFVTPEKEQLLYQLPGFQPDTRRSLANGAEVTVHCGGRPYRANALVTGTFAIPQPKLDVYGDCLRKMMADIFISIDNPGRAVRSPLEAGRTGLHTALLARDSAR